MLKRPFPHKLDNHSEDWVEVCCFSWTVQFQAHSPCHSQLGASPFCVTTGPEGWPVGPSSHILVLEAALAPHGHCPAICQPLATEWLVSEWFLTPDWDLSIGYHLLLGSGLFCVCKWFFPHIHLMPLYLSVPEFTEAWVLPWGELGLDSVCPQLVSVITGTVSRASCKNATLFSCRFSSWNAGTASSHCLPLMAEEERSSLRVPEQRCRVQVS